MFLIFLAGVGSMVGALLIHDGEKSAIPLVLGTGILIWFFEVVARPRSKAMPAGETASRNLLPALAIAVLTFVLYYPTLHIYFLTDDFGCLHAFHHPSLHLFLKMFHTDLAQVVEGETGQEIRPFYALFFMIGYKFFGLHPFGYHLAAVFLHILNALLVFRIADDFAPGKPWRACFAGLFFAVQPAHAWAVSWITGSPAEGIHTVFYLGAFLCFIRFRATNAARYLVLSVISFAACLVAKEIAVTLPVMLLSYDVFRHLLRKVESSPDRAATAEQPTPNRFVAYVSFGLLLLVYFAWRHFVFAHVLGENFWEESLGVQAGQGGAGLLNLARQAGHVARYLLSHHASNIRSLLIPAPRVAGIALGLYLGWTLWLWQRRAESARSIAMILYFGVAWYLISDLPLLVAAFEPRHLYLVAVGPCIATAFLIFPDEAARRNPPKIFRFAGAALLIGIFAFQLWGDIETILRRGEVTARAAAQMAGMVEAMPKQSFVLISFREHGFLPFALQPPFTRSDLSSQVRIMEYPNMCDCPLSRWRENAKQILGAELAGPANLAIDITLLEWDDQSRSMREVKRRIPRESFRAAVTKSLGGPTGALDAIDEAAGTRLFDSLANLMAKKP